MHLEFLLLRLCVCATCTLSEIETSNTLHQLSCLSSYYNPVFSYLSTVYMSISFTNCTFMYTQKWKSSSVKSVCL